MGLLADQVDGACRRRHPPRHLTAAAVTAWAVTARTCALNQLKALIVAAPEELRAELRGRRTSDQVS
jgi:transposase